MQFNRKNIIITSMILLLFVVGYAYNMFTTDNYIGINYDLELDQQTNEGAFIEQTEYQTVDVGTSVQSQDNVQTAEVIEQNPATVETSSSIASSFFSEYRMEREKNRSKEVEMWQEVINNQNTEKTFKNLAQQELVKIVALTEKEMIIENMVISLGFSDALAFMTDDSITVIVETKELTPAQVARIQDIVVRKTKLSPTNIKIMKKN
ncbi:MAG: SpoIIIAH-like family protein [Lutisporaceae bacterium]